MISTRQIPTQNGYLDMLRQTLDAGDGAIDWLVITVDDAAAIRRLESAMSAVDSVALLAVPEATWAEDQPALRKAVNWALDAAPISKLVVVGASAASALAHQSARSGTGRERSLFGGVVQSASAAARERRHAQERFAQRVAALLELPRVQQQITAKRLSFLALYYRDESQSFAAFDPATRTFQALQTG